MELTDWVKREVIVPALAVARPVPVITFVMVDLSVVVLSEEVVFKELVLVIFLLVDVVSRMVIWKVSETTMTCLASTMRIAALD